MNIRIKTCGGKFGRKQSIVFCNFHFPLELHSKLNFLTRWFSLKSAILFRLHLCLWAFALWLYPINQVHAQREIKVNQNIGYLSFPFNILFTAQIESDSPLDRVMLIYSTNAHSCVSSSAQVEVEIPKKTSVTAEWTWHLNNLPPGAVVTWQWQIRDAAGHNLTTPEQKLTVDDTHYAWQKLESGKISVFWSDGSTSFGQQILNTASTSLARLEKSLGIVEPYPIRLMIYPGSKELRAAIPDVPDWTGGIALSEYDTIMSGIDPKAPDYIYEVIPHELAHLVVDQRIDNCVGSQLPTWLNEGLAVYAEGPTSKSDQSLITNALQRGETIDLRDLTLSFPPKSDQAHLAYAQCGMIATYLVNTYGPGLLDQLFEQVKQGVSINKSLQAVYHLDTHGIELAWRASLGYEYATLQATPVSPTAKVQRTLVPTLDLFSTPTGTATPAPSPTIEKTFAFTVTPIPSPVLSSTSLVKISSTTTPPIAPSLPVWSWFVVGAVCLLVAALIILLRTRGGTPS